MATKNNRVGRPFKINASPMTLLLVLLFASATSAMAAEQWGWTAEIRRGNQFIASDPTVYSNQGQAAAAMRRHAEEAGEPPSRGVR